MENFKLTTVFNTLTEYITNKCKNDIIEELFIQIWTYIFNIDEIKEYLTTTTKITFISKKSSNVILTMTTCKRLNLFKQTVNSMFNTWEDIGLIDKWYVIDDNSSEDDRNDMTETYPFINYIMKEEENKGHKESMNIIYDLIKDLDPTYWIHIEDDFLFFQKMAYISLGINGLNTLSHFNVKQIMFNRNYIEDMTQINLVGHVAYSDNTFAFHDYQLGGTACKYWPYFSFRPSIIEANAVLEIGNFDSSATFFEIEYAKKYTDKGYKTAFLNTISNIHTGKKNNASNNAYKLNDIPQFDGESKSFNIQVINLKRRNDRYKTITEKLNKLNLRYTVFNAIDSKELEYSDEINKLFKNNDFKSRKGFIACALSHYYLWKQLVESEEKYYIIIEDDANFCKNFTSKLDKIKDQLSDKDIVFLGYLKTPENKELYKSIYDIDNDHIKIDNLKKEIYIGGTHCYFISKEGAKKLLEYIDENGIKHGIDYMMGKIQNRADVYETMPHMSFAEWRNGDNYIDSDIQYDTDSFTELESPDNIRSFVIEDFIFIKGLDQIGNDCCNISSNSSLDDYIYKYNHNSNCVAFNTLGFFKNKVESLTASLYFSENDGIYINKDYYFDVFKKKSR